jgi:hypothetical protein
MPRKPQRFQRSRKKGARLPPGTVCVTRGTKWGNRFEVGVRVATNKEAAREFSALCWPENWPLPSPMYDVNWLARISLVGASRLILATPTSC